MGVSANCSSTIFFKVDQRAATQDGSFLLSSGFIVGRFYIDFAMTDCVAKSFLKTPLFIDKDRINHVIISSQGSCIVTKINSVEALEKLHRAVMVQFTLIVFHQHTVMKGIMIMNHSIASNH